MTGHWNVAHHWHEPFPYGDTTTYELAEAWLRDCKLVEDWGCGLGWSRRYFRAGQWRGIDGSKSPTVSEVVDLAQYRSQVPGILMRHVLEHNDDWAMILDNALNSFTERMALILFTPMAEKTGVIAWNCGYEVPDISFRALDLESRFPGNVDFRDVEDLHTNTLYGVERIYYLARRR